MQSSTIGGSRPTANRRALIKILIYGLTMSMLRQCGRFAFLISILIASVPVAAFGCKVDYISSWSVQPPKGPIVKLIESAKRASPERQKAVEGEVIRLFAQSRKLAADDCGAPLVAAANGYRDLLEHFIAAKVEMYDGEALTHGVTPLQAAAMEGHLAVVKLLIEKKVANINEATPHRGVFPRVGGITALQWAVMSGHLDVAEYLLSKGANTKLRGNGRTALDRARARYEDEMVALLEKYGATE